MLSSDVVFNQQMLECGDDSKDRTRMLVDSCSLLRTDNGLFLIRFSNGLEVHKCPVGHIRYV